MGRAGLGIVLTLAACGRTPEPEVRVQEQARGPVQAEPTPAAPTTPYTPPEAAPGIYGHVRVAEPFALLAKVSDQLAPATASGDLTITALRDVAKAQARTDLSKALAEHFDPGRPVACALVDPAEHAIPLACVFGVEGGLRALAQGLPQAEANPARPGAKRYDIEGLSLYLDALGPDVVVAFDAAAFDDAKDYLGTLARPGGTWDVEATLFPATAAATYAGPLELAAAATLTELAPMANDPALRVVTQIVSSQLAVLVPLLTRRGAAVTRELLDTAAIVDRMRIGVRLDDAGLRIGAMVEPTATGGLRRKLTSQPALGEVSGQWLPRHTWLAVASSGAEPILPQTRALLAELAVGLAADAVGVPQIAAADITALFDTPDVGTYAPGSTFVAFNGPGTWGGAALVRRLQPDASGRDAWRRWAESVTPSAVLDREGARELEKMVDWSVDRGALEVAGVAVDRWKVEANRAFLRKLRRSVGEEADISDAIVAWIRDKPALVAVDRFELDERAVYAFAPGGEVAYAERIAGARDAAHRTSTAQLQARLATHPRPLGYAAISALDVARFLRELLPPDLAAPIPERLGQGLGDVFAGAWATEQGEWVGQIVVAQPLLDLVRNR